MPDCPYCGEMHSPMMKCSAQRKAEAVKTALAVTRARLRQLRLRLQLRNLQLRKYLPSAVMGARSGKKTQKSGSIGARLEPTG
jgi:hypothetical protein